MFFIFIHVSFAGYCEENKNIYNKKSQTVSAEGVNIQLPARREQ